MVFTIGMTYTKNNIYDILDVPEESRKGSWDTGYRSYNDEIFVFVNVGTTARTGDNHGNYWINDKLVWFGKRTSNVNQLLIRKMILGTTNVHVFCRDNSRDPFTYYGLGKVLYYEQFQPVKIIWTFENIFENDGTKELVSLYKEGALINQNINIYKRSLKARDECISWNGCICCICGFDFEKIYGKIGVNFIHIHHLKELSQRKEEYMIDPKIDLAPVCPNCHSMLHKKNPAYTIQELRDIIKSNCG